MMDTDRPSNNNSNNTTNNSSPSSSSSSSSSSGASKETSGSSKDTSGSSKETADLPPNPTLYINNLNEKIKKDELVKSLHALFSRFGTIVDIVAHKSDKLRGQAWVVFKDVVSSSNALRDMQNFQFYDKPLRVAYAKTKSDATAKADGSFVERKRPEKRKAEDEGVVPRKAKKDKKDTPKKATTTTTSSSSSTAAAAAAAAAAMERQEGDILPRPAAPNNTLLLENLPETTDDVRLTTLFRAYPGFREVRTIPGRRGIAFIDFETIATATVAMNALQHFKFNADNIMVISYAK